MAAAAAAGRRRQRRRGPCRRGRAARAAKGPGGAGGRPPEGDADPRQPKSQQQGGQEGGAKKKAQGGGGEGAAAATGGDDLTPDGWAAEDWPDEDWEEESPYVLGGPGGDEEEEIEGDWGGFNPRGARYIVGKEQEMEGEEEDEWEELEGEEAGGKAFARGGAPGAKDGSDGFEGDDEWAGLKPGGGPFVLGSQQPLDDEDWDEEDLRAGRGGDPMAGAFPMDDDGDKEDWPGDWPEDAAEGEGEEDWEDEADFNMAGFRFEDPMGGSDTVDFRKGSVLEGMDDEPEYVRPEEQDPLDVSAREMSLLYDDFEITNRSQTLKRDDEARPRSEGMMRERKQKEEVQKKKTGRPLDKLEEREYVVAAEGIAVRTLPDERSPQTGEILRQGEKFTAIEAVDGEGKDQRLYLRLPNGRGWVFDDEKIYPGLPSVKLVSVGGVNVEEDKPAAVKRPLVAVVGRPNVGKSTLVNKICACGASSGTITFDEPGVTRDRTYKPAEHTDDRGDTYLFDVVDTGGLIFYDDPEKVTFKNEIRLQIDVALREATAAIIVVDSQTGLVEEDMQIATYIRNTYADHGLKVVVAVAKCDRVETMDVHCAEFWALEVGEPIPTSAYHGRGVWEVVDKVVDRGCDGLFPMRIAGQDPPPSIRDGSVSVAIVGTPNAGKSSLLNALTGEARAIVSDIPGTTTDSIDAYLETTEGKIYRFIDTAGIRRTGRIEPGTEWLSVNRSIKAVKRADIALMCLDASEVMSGGTTRGFAYWCPTNQQRYIARQIEEKGVACVIVLTKWDAVPNKDERTLRKFTEAIRSNLAGVGQWAEVVACSSKTGMRLKKVLQAVDKTLEAHTKRINTPVLNEVIRDALLWRLPAAMNYNQKQGRIYYACQVSARPPVLALFCNNPKLFGANYKTYIENKLRQDLGWFGTPLQLEWRKRGERRAVSTAEQWLGPRLAPEEVWR